MFAWWPLIYRCYSDMLFPQMSLSFPDMLRETVEKRRANYLAGRYAARQLLRDAGCNGAVNTGSDRAPIWPAGWVGSLNHTDKWVIAILAP